MSINVRLRMVRTIWISLLFSVQANYALTLFDDSNWVPIRGLDAWVKTIVVDENSNVYVGGGFTRAGELEVNYVAKWDGSAWHALGAGMNNYVRSLALDSAGNLIAAGEFTEAGGNTANYIAKWDGVQWSPLGEGCSGIILKVIVDEHDQVYAGGNFEYAGTALANNIAKWDGAQWSSLATGVSKGRLSSYVSDVAMDRDGNLHISGDFSHAGTTSLYDVAVWNGSNWEARGFRRGGAADIEVNPLTGDVFYASGNILEKWSGDSWEKHEIQGMAGSTRAFTFDKNGNIYTCGYISKIQSEEAGHIAFYDGSITYPLASGLGEQARALYLDEANDHLYVGGYFLSAGGKETEYIARADVAKMSNPFEHISKSEAEADSDNDGVANVVELIFGRNPNSIVGDTPIFNTQLVEGSELLESAPSVPVNNIESYLTFNYRKKLSHNGYPVLFQGSTCLDFSNENVGIFEIAPSIIEFSYEIKKYVLIPDFESDSAFIRAKVQTSK